eukprot:1159874-Pelagomonas_calceolata.AAC.8
MKQLLFEVDLHFEVATRHGHPGQLPVTVKQLQVEVDLCIEMGLRFKCQLRSSSCQLKRELSDGQHCP